MKLKLTVTGMTCAACSARVEKVTREVAGVARADVNLLSGTMQVEAQDASVTQAVIQAVENAGYHAALPGEKKQEPEGIHASAASVAIAAQIGVTDKTVPVERV